MATVDAPFQSLAERIRAQSATAPALVTTSGTLSYGELNRRADLLAQRLSGLELDRVLPLAVALERDAELVVTLLAVLRSGHPYLVLEPGLPFALRRAQAEAAGAPLLLTRNHSEGDWGLPWQVLEPDPDGPGPTRPLVRSAVADAPACLLFTSGSSGRPKPVTLTQGGLAAYPVGFNAGLGLESRDRYLHLASFAYSASVRQLFLPLALGASVAIAPARAALDPVALLEWGRSQGITILDWVPSYLRQVCEALEQLPEARRAPLLANQARILVCSGEPLPWTLVHRWRALGFRGRIGAAYGLTETTGLVAWNEVEAADPGTGPLVPLGTALPHARLQILDSQGRPAGPGEEGGLWVSGPCLAVPGTGPAGYDTGDRFRISRDGTRVFAGRQDDQIKRHGIRLALSEVEAALQTHPEVVDAAVLLEPGAGTGQRLAALLVARPGVAGDDQALRRFLRERYPEAMVPGLIRWVERLPRTLSGKLDRPAVVALWAADQEAAPALATQPDRVAALVRQAWIQALGEAADEGDFFELGGDSLQVITMLSSISASLDKEVPLVAAFFADPTLEGLEAAVRAGLAD